MYQNPDSPDFLRPLPPSRGPLRVPQEDELDVDAVEDLCRAAVA